MMVALTLGVWVAALGSAAALTYDLNRPLHEHRATSQLVESRLAEMPFDAPRQAVAAPVSEPAPALYIIPTITIVGRTPRRAVPVSDPKPKDISQMRCAEWRELDLGSGHVQVCE